jgi:hypothetical protein
MISGKDRMKPVWAAAVIAVWLAIVGVLVPAHAAAAQTNDLRDFRIGMPVSALPASGYGGLACAADPQKRLSAWNDYERCPASADGMRAIGFRYGDDGPGGEDKTQVAGHPVELALLIDNSGQVAGIRIDTDPHARLYLYKKAFLFALQVRARFGEEGWTCRQTAPASTEQPVGGVFIHEHCEKTTESRRYLLDRELFRDPSKDLRDYTSATQLTILRAG